MTLFTIIIPTHNRNEQLAKCIHSIVSQFTSDPPPIIVVDDGSDENNASANEQLCNKNNLQYIFTEKSSGPASARNRGANSSQSLWVVFLDDDVIVSPDWLKLINQKLAECPASCIGIEGRVEPSGKRLWDREVQNRSGGSYLSCHIAYKSEIFKSENGFDTQFKGPCCEDHELAARMLCHGEITFQYDLAVVHQPRTVHRLKYLLSSYKRTLLLLNSEYYFYLKHPDRYHRFRKSRTFAGTLFSNIFFLTYQELKRRSFSQMFHNIPDIFILFLSAAIEQLLSVIWLIKNSERIFHPAISFFGNLINFEKTAELWRIKNYHQNTFVMRKNSFNTLTFRYLKKSVYNAYQTQKKISRISSYTEPQVFIRIDDLFFDNLQKVHLFIGCIDKLKPPVMVAVRGDDIQNPKYYPILKELKDAGIFIGVHGFTHTGKYGPFDSELLQMNYSTFEQKITPVIQILASLGQHHSILVPPFNAIDREQIQRWSKVCSIICGGPETSRFTDQHYGPVALSNAGWYFPSIQPFYGDAQTMSGNNVSSLIKSLNGPICLTMHFTQEQQDNFNCLTEFLEKIYPYISRWEETESW